MQLDPVAITLWSKSGGVSHWVGREGGGGQGQFDGQKFLKYTYYCVESEGMAPRKIFQFQESLLDRV